MRGHRQCLASVVLVLGLAACAQPAGPRLTLPIQTAPDLGARVVSSRYQQWVSPVGVIAQYELWVAIAPSDTANAGVLVTAGHPVFVRSGTVLTTEAASQVAAGDSILVWKEVPVPMGSSPPPGAPGYAAEQLVVVR